MTDPELDLCPWCSGDRLPDDAGPGFVDWCCQDCGRVSREAVTEP